MEFGRLFAGLVMSLLLASCGNDADDVTAERSQQVAEQAQQELTLIGTDQ